MKRNSERGVALVITLIMLALVTFMAVVFLAVSRREKTSVTVTGDMMTARLMTDTAVARAEAELVSRMMASSNAFDYDLLVSTNYYNRNGFQPGIASPLNVNFDTLYDHRTPVAANGSYWIQNIANLQYDARVPVVFPTNRTGLGTNDFRFFIDMNRNGWFEPTGLLYDSARKATNFYVGDPQWIGVLERPDLPHSETNLFIGRYAFVVVPSGKTLDINFLYNAAKRLRDNLTLDSYFRNQGVGSWEINLPAFLAGLNSNVWSYSYNPNLATPSLGSAFEDADLILAHRYDRSIAKLASASSMFRFAANPNNPFALSGVDYYSDGPVVSLAPDPVNQPWAGAYNPNGYYDIQELFDPAKVSPLFAARLTNLATAYPNDLYNRYMFYRLLAQMSTDSAVPESNKIYFADYQLHYTNRMHLHYQNLVPNGQTNFIPWTPLSFFGNAAERLLRVSLDPLVLTNGARLQTNFMMGLTPVRESFCCTNIQLYHIGAGRPNGLPFYVTNNEYSSTVHRLLQVAANIYDATTTRRLPGSTNDYPSVFRPVFMRTGPAGGAATNLIIHGFVEETNTTFLNLPWMTIEQAALSSALPVNQPLAGLNLYGVPMVIGAKKGYPNFNKFVVQTVANVSRRLQLSKTSPNRPPTETNQMYIIGVSNRVAVEGWNSYQHDLNRNLELLVTNLTTFAFYDRPEGTGAYRLLTNHLWLSGVNMPLNRWPGFTNSSAANSFVVPIDTNVVTLADSIYRTLPQAVTAPLLPLTTNVFEKSYRVPQWLLHLTNRIQYILIDRTANRVLDFVNLDKLVTEVDLSKGLTGATNSSASVFGDKKGTGTATGQGGFLSDNDMWDLRHSGKSIDSPALGLLNQISVAKGSPFVGEGVWASPTGQPGEKQAAIDQFKAFLLGSLTNLHMQVPFTPSRSLYQRNSWEANDPLVHYTTEDLAEPIVPGVTNFQVRAVPQSILPQTVQKESFVRQINPRRYRPWDGQFDHQNPSYQTAYALTVKDPLVRGSDDWQFPTNRFPNIGWLGRVHRGSPWQTIYLKAPIDPRTGKTIDLNSWYQWAGSFGTHPTNDWRLLDLFTVAPNDNASRGLLSVNQTNYAAWAAVLSGVTVLSNSLPDAAVGPTRPPRYSQVLVQPNTRQMLQIVDGINRAHLAVTNRSFRTLGDLLSVPELTVASPFLNIAGKQREQGIDDATYERIPQEILSLVKTDEPRVTIYAFGQSLKPADRSLVSLASPPIFNLCTNYQVMGEFATKTVLRLDELPGAVLPTKSPSPPVAQKMRAVVESYTVLQPD